MYTALAWILLVLGAHGETICPSDKMLLGNTCVKLVRSPCSSPVPCDTNGKISSHEAIASNTSVNVAAAIEECVPGAVCCSFPGPELPSVCTCSEGFVETHDRKCAQKHGAKCDTTEEITVLCDSDKLLDCIDGRCQCKSPGQHYDEILERCSALVGSSCNLEEGQPEPQNFDKLETVSCTHGAICLARYKGQRYAEGVCKCSRPYFVETINKTCLELNANGEVADGSVSLMVLGFIGCGILLAASLFIAIFTAMAHAWCCNESSRLR